jgi:hypothetical protein
VEWELGLVLGKALGPADNWGQHPGTELAGARPALGELLGAALEKCWEPHWEKTGNRTTTGLTRRTRSFTGRRTRYSTGRPGQHWETHLG